MEGFGSFFQTGDWKGEKHVPVIHAPEKVKAGEKVELKLSIGDAIGHPNEFEHYISWAKMMFLPDGAKFPIELASFDFAAHGESDIFTEPTGLTTVKLKKTGTLYAIIYCNIHGLWINSQKIEVE